MSLPSVRRWFAAVLVVLIAYFALAPGQRTVSVGLVGVSAAAIVAYGAVAQKAPHRGAWLSIAAAIVAMTFGFVAEIASGALARPEGNPIPTAVIYLLVYLLFAVGLLWLGRPRTPSRDVTTMLDAMAITLTFGFVAWIVVVQPQLEALRLNPTGQVTAIATWVGYLAIVSGVLRLVLAWRMSVALASTIVAIAVLLVATFLYGVSRMNRTSPDTGLIGALFFAFCGLMGLAALSPSMTLVASVPFGQYRLGPLRLAILALALLAAPTALLVEAASGVVGTAVAIAVLSSAVGVLVLIRLALAIRDYRQRVARGDEVLVATRASVVATRAEEVEAAVCAAFGAMLPSGARFAMVLDDQPCPDPDVATPAAGIPRVRQDGMGELCIPDEGDGQRSFVFTASPMQLMDLAGTLNVLAGQASSALTRIDLTRRLRGEERDRYFRTLILTSSDVILISRLGRIEYSTPSAYGMFGRDLIGAAFDDVVERRHPDWPTEQSPQAWTDTEAGGQGRIRRPDAAEILVEVRRRDLRDDPTVNGVVTTLRDVTREQEFQQALAYRASHDPLTGLANAETFRQLLDAGRARTDQRGVHAALFIDLDDFKMINDTYGHEVGDGMLVTVARRIQSCLSENDVAARVGGDEFAVLLPHVQDEPMARETARRMAEELARPANVAGVDLGGGASIGLSIARTSDDVDTLLRRADTALYEAKSDGKGRWREYHEGMATPGRRTTDLRHQLEAAIRDQTVTLHYEPIVELATGQVDGFEALIRLDSGAGHPMQPEELVAITEDSALMSALNDWVLHKALTDITIINRSGAGRPRHVGVTFSARQLRQPGFAETVRTQLAATNVDAEFLIIGIAESVLLAQESEAWNLLAQLRDDGVRVAVDDYGIGYASLSCLRHSELDIVKIDGSFLADLTSRRSRLLLEAVVRLPATLGLDEIAKGVDDMHARDVLVSLGCRYGQGSLYGAAMPLSEAVRWQPVERRT